MKNANVFKFKTALFTVKFNTIILKKPVIYLDTFTHVNFMVSHGLINFNIFVTAISNKFIFKIRNVNRRNLSSSQCKKLLTRRKDKTSKNTSSIVNVTT